MTNCAKCGTPLDAVVGIDRYGRMYHPECDPKDIPMAAIEAWQEIGQQRQWERVKLVAEIASRLYNHRAPVVMDALIYEAIAIVEAAEKLCQETKT